MINDRPSVQGTAVSKPPAGRTATDWQVAKSIRAFKFFNPYADIQQTKNRLPHWQQIGALYFVTFRLADSIPANLRVDLERHRRTWLRLHPKPWNSDTEHDYHEQFSGQIERWLDAGYGSCILRPRKCAMIVDAALAHFEDQRMSRIASVVMPNHVHVLFVQNPEHPLEKLLQSWKTYTARQLNELIGHSGPLWQKDYFDRLIRDEQHFANCVVYIRRNPAKAKLKAADYIYYESDVARQIE